MKKIIHLSHNDLDGYGAQLVSSKTGRVIDFLNTNYGAEILEKAELAITAMNEDFKNHMLLITDVNLTMEIADTLDSMSKELGFELLLIDHHATGKAVAEKYNWYNLDITQCATRLTFEYFEEEISDLSMNEFSKIVNAYDLWKENLPEFSKGKVLNELVYEGYKFPKETQSLKNSSILFNLESMNKFLMTLDVYDAEGKLKSIKESFLKDKIPNDILNDRNKIINDKYHYLVFKEFQKFDLPIIKIDNTRLKVFYNLDGGVFQNISSFFNNEKDSYDGCINVLKTGILSLRTKGTEEVYDVSSIAKKYFGGGGHFNASGGFLSTEKKEFSREEVLEILNNTGGL